MKPPFVAISLFVLGAAHAADPVKLTLPDAVRMAIAQNRTLKIVRLKVVENEQKKLGARASYFPEIKNQSTAGYTTAEGNIEIPAGAFGVYPGSNLVPSRDLRINQGDQSFVTSGTSLTQPLTPLIRIRAANRIAAAAVAGSRDELKKAENEVALKVHEVYFGILIASLQKKAAEQQKAYSTIRLRESEEDLRNGNTLAVSKIESQASVLQSEQSRLTLELRIADLTAELDDLLGLPIGAAVELNPVALATPAGRTREEALKLALDENPKIAAAQTTVQQAKAAVTAAKSAYIPDVAVFARHSYQNGIPFLVHNFGTFGIALNYDVFDFGKRRAGIREREAQLAQAEQNVERLREAVSVEIERAFNKVERTRQMLQVASEVVKLRQEGERIAANQLTHGVILASARSQASAANYQAQAELLQAQLTSLLARAELEESIGRTPGQ